mmetsp:Transcript_22879/g.52400  ORF Transcript_22879/g.52400 Transcript_22879/m.52400 type:complete len:489 (+) Transcript_22879:119-1585(+)
MALTWLCLVAFVPAFAVRPLDAGTGPQSLLQQDSEHQVKGVGDLLTSARASTILGAQLTSDLSIVEQHSLEIQEELDQTTREIGVLNKQLEEDKTMEKSLTKQIDAIRKGRTATVKDLSGAMSAAGESAKKVVQDGWKAGSHIQVAATEDDVLASPASDRTGQTSSLLQEVAQSSGGGYGLYGDEFPGDDQIWNPLREKSQHMEQTLDLLVAQRMKVDGAVNHEQLTLKKLSDDLKMLEAMKAASQAQEDKLRKGRAESLLKMYSTMYEGADAAKQAMSLGVGGSKTPSDTDQEVDERSRTEVESVDLPPISNSDDEVKTTTDRFVPVESDEIVQLPSTTKGTEPVDPIDIEGDDNREPSFESDSVGTAKVITTTKKFESVLEMEEQADVQPQRSKVKTSHHKSSKHPDNDKSSRHRQTEHVAAHRLSDVGTSHKRAESHRQDHHNEVLVNTKIVEQNLKSHKAHHKEKAHQQKQQQHHEKRHGRHQM